MRAFWLALQFLTRLPVPQTAEYTAEDRGRSVLYYPVVGLLIGAVLTAFSFLLANADPGLRAALLLLVWVLLTGALHLDGLADSADAWLGGHGDRARTLEIMKDSRSGPAAIVAVALVLIVKFAALSTLTHAMYWPALMLAPLLGRASLVLLFLTTPYVRAQGIGAAHAANLPRGGAAVVLLTVAVLVPVFLGYAGLWPVAAALAMVWLLRRLMLQRLGGATGDTLGASCEIVEAAVLVVMVLAGAPLGMG
ncbi:MAG: adenosylcobinamide-GDP ribazoletransferase [Gammaproteobacteria bacterium]|nr:adenosylcobinamide-GDP ribazoletransferase [Gammaproteobacteria bacterium]